MPIAIWIVLFFSCILPVTAAPKPLQKFEKCALVPTEWADGDSFQIRTTNGEEHTIRLYGVDCLELHVVGNDRNLDRLREQRRYFGITDAGKNTGESMKIAADLAKVAAEFTARSLQKPFTLHTRFSDGGGDPNFERIYGFITLADGKDLGRRGDCDGWRTRRETRRGRPVARRPSHVFGRSVSGLLERTHPRSP